MAQASACDECGYRPRTKDGYHVILDEGVDNLEVKIHYVRCYSCGAEWVE